MPDPSPALRASDADRERVAARLRAAGQDGRLDVDELEDRLSRAYAARTVDELEPLTADLAPEAPAPPPKPSEWHARWRPWLGTSVMLIGIWAIICIASGHLIFFWPIFPIGFWALGNVAAMIGGDDPRNGPRRLHGRPRHHELRRPPRRY